MRNRMALAVVFFLAAIPNAGAFHELDCGPFRTTVFDKKTGEKKCLAQSPQARRQFQRFQKLQRDQEKRTRDLQLQQLQRDKAQALIEKQALNKQQQFTRRNSARQQESALSVERAQKLQDGLSRQDSEAVRRKGQLLENDLLRQGNLLEQQIELPRADLLDGQKSLNRRLLKDQAEQ
ncbi:MAG: hypothetical protein HQ513_09440 [Rhodospirillales bacterium]|nr:hypothetical protein [Rhodospirillales bacterium]